MIRLVLADDHTLLREGLRRSFEAAGDLVVAEAANGEEAVNLAVNHRPDVVVMDLSMPVVDGVAATARIRSFAPGVRVAVLTMHDDIERTRDAISAGASAYLTKGTSFSDLHATIHRVAAGETVLSPELAEAMLAVSNGSGPSDGSDELLSERQVEILQVIANGRSTKQTARELGITTKTVHNHLNAIYRKLDAQSLTHAVLSAVRLGIIELEPAQVD
jgi:DNA-binding NarL/FixJ family response regulator